MRRLGLALPILLLACASPPPSPPSSPPAQPPLPVAKAIVDVDAGPASDPCAGDTFGLTPEGAAIAATKFDSKKGTMGVAAKRMVATSHKLATDAGLEVLRKGGNAADAFVAATLVQDVVLPGVTSTAGLTGVMIYDAKTKSVTYVHGGLADPIDPAMRYKPSTDAQNTPGKLVLVPGAPAAYAEIVKRFGKRKLKDDVEPAAKIATDGFATDSLYGRTIHANEKKLAKSAYAKKTFFHDDGKPISEGETLKLTEVGKTLRAYGADPSLFYKGAWPRDAAKVVKDNGGTLVAKDFETYALEVSSPIHGHFMGHDVYAAGHGGAKLLVTLEALEIVRGGKPDEPPSANADALERFLRIQRITNRLPFLRDRVFLARGAVTEPDIEVAARDVAKEALRRDPVGNNDEQPSSEEGTHSSAVIVVDDEGNVVVGTHTIETLAWGEGLFVGGIPLSTAAPQGFDDATVAKSRVRTDPLTNTIVMKDGQVRAALAVYGSGLHLADAEILDGVIARGLDAEAAILEPRVGYFQFDIQKGDIDFNRNVVDPRFDAKLLCTMKKRGFGLDRSSPGYPPGVVDTGFPTLITLSGSAIHGMTPERMNGVAAGE